MKHFLLIMLSTFVLTACDGEIEYPLRVGTNNWIGYEPLYLARDVGFYNETEVKLIEYASTSEVLRAFRNKSLDVAALTLDETLLLMESKTPVQVVLIMDISNGADVIMSRPQFKDIVSLKGKRIGVESSALGAYVLSRALALNGLSLNDVNIVHLNINEHLYAYNQDKVDALVTFEPVRTKLLDHGAIDIFSSRDIPNEVIDVLVMRTGDTKTINKKIRRLIKGWFQTLDYIRQDPLEAATLMGKRIQIEPEKIHKSMDDLIWADIDHNKMLLTDQQGTLSTALKELQAVMLELDLLEHPVLTDDLFSTEMLFTN